MNFDTQALFNSDQQILSADLNGISTSLYNILRNFNLNVINQTSCIISGLGVSWAAGNPGVINVASGVALFEAVNPANTWEGSLYYLSQGQSVPITGGANLTYATVDGIDLTYSEVPSNSQNRNQIDPSTRIVSSVSLNTQLFSTYTITVTQGVPAARPVAPPIPTGAIRLATFTVDAGASVVVDPASIVYALPFMFENQTFPGTPNTANQSSTLADSLAAIRSQLNAIIGVPSGTWYNVVPLSLSRLKTWGGTDTGSANNYAISISNFPLPLISGQELNFIVGAGNTNTGASTLAINGGTPIAIKDAYGNSIVNNLLVSGQTISLIFDGTYLRIPYDSFPQMVFYGGTSGGGPAAYTLTISGFPTNTNIQNGTIVSWTIPTPNTNLVGVTVAINGQTALNLNDEMGYQITAPDMLTLGQKVAMTFISGAWYLIGRSVVRSESFYGVDSGSANAYNIVSPIGIKLFVGTMLNFIPTHNNTGASTITVNGGLFNLVDTGGGALSSGVLVANHLASLIFDGTAFRLMNPL